MKKVRFRLHRGGLVESLATTVSVESLNDVLEFIDEFHPFTVGYGCKKVDELFCEFYGNDARIGWETYAIKNPSGHIIGFSDGPLEWVDKNKDKKSGLNPEYMIHITRWISVKNELPDEDLKVLIRLNNCKIDLASLKRSSDSYAWEKFQYDDIYYYRRENVTHWMPIPEFEV